MAWLSGWDKRIELDIDYTNKINGSVTWFPVTIFLEDGNGETTKVFDEVGANSRQIAITKADGDTELKGEIEQWSYDAGTPANSTAVIHTSATGWVINANTSIFIYYKSGHANNPNIDVINTVPGAAVWDGSMVQHMVDDAGGNIDDSTDNDIDGTKLSAGNPAEAVGKVGKCQEFSSDYITLPASAEWDFAAGDFTIEFLLYPTAETRGSILGSGSAVSPFWVWIDYDTLRGSDRNISIWASSDGGSWNLIHADIGGSGMGNISLTLNTWNYIVFVRSGNSWKTYINTVNDVSVTVAGTVSTVNSTREIGRQGSFGYPFPGRIDEMRVIKGTARSEAWIKGTYNSLWDSLLAYGSEETEVAVEVNSIFFGCNF